MTNPFQIQFTLRQHTPMIHFQYDQDGATLRASEVKPKLDKFIKSKVEESVWKKWLSGDGKNHEALDYKIRIETKNVFKESIEKNPLFFGDTGSREAPKFKFSMTQSPLRIQIDTLKTDLRATIEKVFIEFLKENNFANRQNKGFGSFFLDPSVHKDCFQVFENLPYVSFTYTDENNVYAVIDYYYKLLKSGLNHPNFGSYQHGFLKQYLEKTEPYIWEKRWMKETFFDLPANDKPKKFARLFLGLPAEFRYKETTEPKNPNITEKLRLDDDYQITIEHKEVDRLASPLLFKPILDNKTKICKIYLIVQPLPEELKKVSKTFTFIPHFQLRISGRLNERTNRIGFKQESVPVNYNNLELKGKYEAIIIKAEDFESRDGNKQGYEKLKGQMTRFQSFIANHSVQQLDMPDNFINLKDLLSEYHKSLGKNFIVKHNLISKPIKVEIHG